MIEGYLRKLKHEIDTDTKVIYKFNLVSPNQEELVIENFNQYLSQKISLEFLGEISCVACGRKISKSFNQGYCFPCMRSLAECDICIVKPELCHFDKGSCRDNEFAASHCNIPHSLYISMTSDLKIGITRSNQEKKRWVDQGAIKALKILGLKRRYHAGLIESILATEMKDKTDWRKMLKNEFENQDLNTKKNFLLEKIQVLVSKPIAGEDLSYVLDNIENNVEQAISYPVTEYPQKITSFNLDKNPLVEGVLMGIKGQYLILDTGVINLRKYTGYKIKLQY